MLNRLGLQGLANLFEPGDAVLPFGATGLHLDQFMGLERAVDFLQHGGGEPGIANQDNGFETVGQPLQVLALGGGEYFHGRILV